MLRFKDGKFVKTRLFASISGCRTSRRNVLVQPNGGFVESDWTSKTCAILNKQPALAICRSRPADRSVWTGSSHVTH